MTAKEALKTIIQKCDFLFDGEIISRELLMRQFVEFLSDTTEKEKHNSGFVLHTGSDCFNVVAVAYAAVTCLVYNESDTEEVVSSLKDGDLVLFKGQRCVFNGFPNDNFLGGRKYILLSQGTDKTYVPQGDWRHIQPYYGNSQMLDGRGVRKKGTIRDEFYKDVLGYKASDIPAVLNASVALVMPRDMADSLMEKIAFQFNKKTIRLLDLITASYFTENEEYPYGGNAAKTEATLKVSGKISVARKMVVSRRGNKHIGIMVFGNETVSRCLSELPELLNRQSLPYIYLLMNVDSEHAMTLIREVDRPNVFLCSKPFLLQHSHSCISENKYTLELSKQVSTIIRRCENTFIANGWLTWEEYKAFKKSVFAIKNSDYSSSEKDSFIIISCYLMNLFSFAPFKIADIDQCISSGLLTIPYVEDRLSDLNSYLNTFPTGLQEQAKQIVSVLETSYCFLYDKNEKEEYLRGILRDNKEKRVAIVVPKAYYITIMRECGYFDIMDNDGFLTIVTANRFDHSVLYDLIIVLGNYEGKRFNTFKCTSSPIIETVLYSYESKPYRRSQRIARRAEAELNALNTTEHRVADESVPEDLYYSDASEDADAEELAQLESSVNDYISQLNEIAFFGGIDSLTYQAGSTTFAEIIAAGTFDSGEKIFFTKFYKAYVFDESEGVVKETNVSDLNEGDSLVFTQNTAETRDIVDTVLAKLVDEHKVDNEVVESYELSKKWKQVLRDYMHQERLPAKTIAEKMIENGASVQEITIRGWMDEDSHTIGPRNADSIKQIALLVENEEMYSNSDKYYKACSVIRKIRRKILKWIGEAIIDKLSGREPEAGTVKADIYNRIDSVAQILCLESITPIEQTIPMHLTNRPVNL